MKRLPLQGRTLIMLVVLLPLLVLFVYVALRSGPLAPISVTVTKVESRSVTPGLFGIGTVEAKHTYKIGPTFAGRIKILDVDVGDYVKSGQVLGEMDPIDLDQRIHAQEAALKRAEAQLSEAQASLAYAQTQARRYQELLGVRSTSEEIFFTKKREQQVAEANLNASRAELTRVQAEREALQEQRKSLVLVAPADGLVSARNADPGTTIVAGQAVIEMINPKSLWINTRFDQIHSDGLAADLPVGIVLRTRAADSQRGRILRLEPMADAVTEETLAKVVFDHLPERLPAVGELAEITVFLPALPAGPVIPNAAIQRIHGKIGVWQVINDELRFTPVTLGGADLDGHVQVREGLKIDNQIVVYSARTLNARSSIRVVDHLQGVKP
ncbi:MAG: efflux RND transporter periplasmic adaptor subunit [Desulfobulbus sp.]|nr:efflux RND transporter periplasmic adaptor subunit [Desulfobulbus sp.]